MPRWAIYSLASYGALLVADIVFLVAFGKRFSIIGQTYTGLACIAIGFIGQIANDIQVIADRYRE